MKRSKILPLVFVVFVALALLPVPGQASITYSNRTAWEASVAQFQDVDIDGLLTIPGEGFDLAPNTPINLPLTGNSLAFDTPLTVLKVPGTWASWSGGYLPTVLFMPDDLAGTGVTLTGTFIHPMDAFGLELEPEQFGLFELTLLLSDGNSLSQFVEGDAGAAFFGWIGGLELPSVTGFQITSAAGAGGFAIGRMVEGSQVPLPPSVLLLGSGLLGFFGIRRFKN